MVLLSVVVLTGIPLDLIGSPRFLPFGPRSFGLLNSLCSSIGPVVTSIGAVALLLKLIADAASTG